MPPPASVAEGWIIFMQIVDRQGCCLVQRGTGRGRGTGAILLQLYCVDHSRGSLRSHDLFFTKEVFLRPPVLTCGTWLSARGVLLVEKVMQRLHVGTPAPPSLPEKAGPGQCAVLVSYRSCGGAGPGDGQVPSPVTFLSCCWNYWLPPWLNGKLGGGGVSLLSFLKKIFMSFLKKILEK